MIQAGFTSPAPGSSVSRSFTVTGFVFQDGDPGSFPPNAVFKIINFFVRFGPNEPRVNVQPDRAGHWSATGSPPRGTGPGEPVAVTLTVSGSVTNPANPSEPDDFEVTATLNLIAGLSPVTPLDLKFAPTFSHRKWHNNVDRIVAGGPNGFNVRFEAIDTDLRQAAAVVDLISAALSQTGAIEQKVFTPGLELVPRAAPGSGGWFYDSAGAAHPAGGSGGGVAVMGLTLPEPATLVSFRAIGRWPGGHDLSIRLLRSPHTDATASEVLAEITQSSPGMANPYDLTVPVAPALATVDPGRYRYAVHAQAGFVAQPDAISLSTVQFVYTSA